MGTSVWPWLSFFALVLGLLARDLYSVHVRTRKFRNLEKQSDTSYRHQGPTQKRKAEQESTRIQSATAATAITLFFRVF